jgi:hypothetical protein
VDPPVSGSTGGKSQGGVSQVEGRNIHGLNIQDMINGPKNAEHHGCVAGAVEYPGRLAITYKNGDK